MTIDLHSIIPAKTVAMLTHETEQRLKLPKRNKRHTQGEVRAKLIAQEYVRNGCRLGAAMETAGLKHGSSMNRLAAWQQDIFFEELKRLLERADIERDRALQIMWTMVNTSVLDFIDENGRTMDILQLKRLPRLVQLCINKIKIKEIQSEVRDKAGNVMVDDNGSPYLKVSRIIELEVPERLSAMNQLAQLMKWTGPLVQVNNFNIGRHMMDADMRAEQVNRVYDEAERLSEER